MDEISDDILVAACQSGDKKAYAILVERHYKSVFAICMGIVGNICDAEDISQDAMLRGFLKIRRLRNREKFGCWIQQIARNLCIDFLRRQQRFWLFCFNKPAEKTEEAAEYGDLQQAIGQLPAELRTVLVMHYFNGESVKNIAEKLDVSASGVWQKLRTARKQLHKFLSNTRCEK